MTKLLKLAGAALVLGSFITVAGAASATTTHPTDALGHAKSCRFDYVKRTKRKKVKGKTRRYLACVYVAPKLTSPTITLPVPFKNARVKVTNYGSGVPVVSHNASEKIFGLGMTSSGLASFPLGTYGATATVESDGTNWFITAGALDTGYVSTSNGSGWSNPGVWRQIGNRVELVANSISTTSGYNNTNPFAAPSGFTGGPPIPGSGSGGANSWLVRSNSANNTNPGLLFVSGGHWSIAFGNDTSYVYFFDITYLMD